MARAKKAAVADVVNIPDQPDKTVVTLLGDRILFVTIHQDTDASDPHDNDGFGTIHSLGRRHARHIDIDAAREMLETDVDAVRLSYFEHGNCMWMVAGSPETRTPGLEFQWDGVSFAGVWVPDQSVRDSYTGQDGQTRAEWMHEQARIACAEYTSFCNGDVYGYDVRLYDVRRDGAGQPFDRKDDYRREEEVAEDSCWGFIGWDYAQQCAREAAEHVAKGGR